MTDLFSMGQLKIRDVKNKESITFYAKIDNLNIQKAVNNKEFMNLALIDETGTIMAKKWNVTDDEKAMFKMGQLIYVSGVGNEYNGKLQFIVESIREINDTDDVNLEVFYQSAPIQMDQLKNNILSYLERIKNPKLKAITEAMLKKYEEPYFIYPAASKNHHAYISGLAHHVSTMLNLADAIAKNYRDINMDLLYSGIILHDIGKVIELSDHLAPQYTTLGKLIGHINICFEEIRLTANALNIDGEEVMLLQHLVLSHHGLLEYGSPKTPMIHEAELLHLIDLIDSRMNMIENELIDTQDTEFTKRIYPLDGRAFYKHKL